MEAIREAAAPAGAELGSGKSGLTIDAFSARTGWQRHHIRRFFTSWSDALRAAGNVPGGRPPFAGSAELLEDWGAVTRKLQRPPAYTQYHHHGKYSARNLATRFGSWSNLRHAFLEFAREKREWTDVVNICDAAPAERRGHPRAKCPPAIPKTEMKPHEGRPVYGEPIGPMPLRNAPTNENGVILVFGMLAAELDFHVETVRTAFPDCTALRKVGPRKWQNVRIEFEFVSNNFRLHNHPPDGCDIIVCWEHNWPECPANIEVIALRDVIGKIESVKQEII
ncbi:MAG TPA: hypothetical protein VHC44_03915 [Verrucomicrobiae bacterium]|nr:hypothetical protein [Verrucomicrobiae bacterium]